MHGSRILLTVIALLGISNAAWGSPYWQPAWGDPIATLSTCSQDIPLEDIVPGDELVYYARIPLSIIQDWSDPVRNHGLAIMPRQTHITDTFDAVYANNTEFYTYVATWKWHHRPRLQLEGWSSYPDTMGWIKADDWDFMYTPKFPLGAPYHALGGYFGGPGGVDQHNVYLLRWTGVWSVGGSDLGEYRTLSWGVRAETDGPYVYDVYLVPTYWDEWDVTYGGLNYRPWVHYLPGDANRDRVVNTEDLAILLARWGQNVIGWEQGDFNGDAVVNTNDLGVLLAHWGGGTSIAIPEPATLALLGLGSLGLIRRRR